MFKVGEMAKLIGVDRSFLHYYDEVGIIVPKKNDKKYRLYNENDLIAIASSKYYRALHMPLKTLFNVIKEGNVDSKVQTMEQIQSQLIAESEKLKDLATVAGFAVNLYQLTESIQGVEEGDISPFEFIPLIQNGKYLDWKLEQPEVKALLDFFPFVSYTYHFPVGSLLREEDFCYEIGLATIPYYRKKYHMDLPEDSIEREASRGLNIVLKKNIEEDSFCYQDFAEVIDYAKNHHISLSGEAIAYCVFSNYENEEGNIYFFVQFLTK